MGITNTSFNIDDTNVLSVWSPTANLKWEEEGEFVEAIEAKWHVHA